MRARELLVLRHAKSAWDAPRRDLKRPLAARGERDVPRIAGWIADHGALPDFVVSSHAERARQTALMLAAALEFDAAAIRWDERVYEADLPALLRVLAECPPDARRVALVGHNPGLEELVEYLAGEPLPAARGKAGFPTCGLARLSMPDRWDGLQPAGSTLVALVRPRDLRDAPDLKEDR